MSTKAEAILEQFETLSPAEKQELWRRLQQRASSARRHSVADIAGKYHARPDSNAKDHDRGFAESVA